jgi:hypothetical protein
MFFHAERKVLNDFTPLLMVIFLTLSLGWFFEFETESDYWEEVMN